MVLRGWIVVVVCSLVACGGTSSSSDADDRVEPVDPPGLDVCAAATEMLLMPARLGDAPSQFSSDEEEQRALSALALAMPEELAEPYLEMVALLPRIVDDDPGLGLPEARQTWETIGLVREWARTRCPGAPPSWRCLLQRSGPAEDGPERATTAPEELVVDLATDVLLDRTDAAALFGWLDDEGAVISARVAEVGDDGWRLTWALECQDVRPVDDEGRPVAN